MAARNDITGQRFGRLVVIGYAGHGRWLCACDCGRQARPIKYHLRNGDTRSCGCLYRESIGNRTRTHGLGHTRLNWVWSAMIQRCTNPNNKRWESYGGRGITVCARWRSFENFLADMGKRPRGLTLERLNNDKGYEPANCAWRSHTNQANNRRPRRKAARPHDAHSNS